MIDSGILVYRKIGVTTVTILHSVNNTGHFKVTLIQAKQAKVVTQNMNTTAEISHDFHRQLNIATSGQKIIKVQLTWVIFKCTPYN